MEQNTEIKSPSVLEELNHLVYEYLELNGMEKTLATFTTECQSKSLPSPEPASDSGSKRIFSRRDATSLINCFSTGDLEGFMEIWRNFLSHIQLHGEDLKKLEVYIRVHFAIFPKIYGDTVAAQVKAMDALKEFFDDESDTLAEDKGILPLLALPFVADPLTHPTFYELFEPAWSQRLKLQLETTLAKYFELLQENIGDHSMLVKIVLNMKMGEDGNTKSSVSELVAKYHQERFLQLMNTYRKVRRLLRGTRESYGKLLKVANELIFALESADSGGTTAFEPILGRCFGIFPELFTPDVILNAKPDKEYFKKLAGAAIFDSVIDSDVSLFFIGISDLSPECLDYGKIKSQLTEGGSPSEKLCLLQAIRWLLTRSTPTCREYAMNAFMQSDLLGITSTSSEFRDKLFACMLSPAPTYLKECFVRLLNSIASMKTGRTYLSSNTYSLEILVKSLGSFKGQNESYICQMVVATLQKLSLRKKIRLAMIDLNVIQCLVVYLKSEVVKKGMNEGGQKGEASYNPYLMEYGWALLMNLCLHEESRGAAVSIAPDILTCVVQMLHTRPPRDVAPYVMSTLYSLLRTPDIYTMARRIRLQETLEEILAQEPLDSQRAHPLVQLIDILRVNGFERLTASAEINYDDDDDSDPDEFEPELEVPEGWVGSLELCDQTGDDLLIRNYLVTKPAVVLPTIPPPEVQQTGMHMRPTTPSKSSYTTRTAKPAENEPIVPSTRSKSKRTARKIQDPSLLAEAERMKTPNGESRTRKLESGSHKKTSPAVSGSSSLTNPHISNSNVTTVTIPPRNDPSSSYYIQNVLAQKHGTSTPGAEALRRKLKAKHQSHVESIHHFESLQNKKILAETCMLNMLGGRYTDFDSGMYYDDIFASVSPQGTKTGTKQQDQKSKLMNNTTQSHDQKSEGDAAGELTD